MAAGGLACPSTLCAKDNRGGRDIPMLNLRYLKQQFLKKGRPKILRRALLSAETRRISSSAFFRRFPYAGKMNVRDVDLRCVVIPQHKVLYHRILKNANSSLVATMSHIFEGRELAERIEDKRYSKKLVENVSELGESEVSQLADYTKFLIARNPYERTLSAYLSKVVRRFPKLGPDHPLKKFAASRGAADAPPDFETFCRYLAEGGLYNDLHWSPQSAYLVLPIAQYDFVARLENIDTDFPKIVARIAPWAPATRMIGEDRRHSTAAPSKKPEHFTDAAYAIMADLYRQDFEAFDYDPKAR